MSIKIPVYNRARELPRTVASIVAQDYRPIRLILVDNNSTDDSLSVCREMQQKYQDAQLQIVVDCQPRPGASAARNKGVELVESRYMMFFDSDDELHPDAVSRYMQAFAEHPDADIVGATINFCKGSHTFLAKAIFTSEPEAHIIHGILSTQRFAARTQLIRSVGGWHEHYNGWLDWNFGLRLMLGNPRIYWLQKPPVATVYLHPASITGRNDKYGYTQFYKAIQQTRHDIAASSHPRRVRLERLVIYRQVLLAARILHEMDENNRTELSQLARQIYNEAVNDSLTTPVMRCFFALCLQYASRGGRGSGMVARLIIR